MDKNGQSVAKNVQSVAKMYTKSNYCCILWTTVVPTPLNNAYHWNSFFGGNDVSNNGTTNLKRPLSYQQQLDHLVNDKKLVVDNYSNALSILKRENYYRLSGYWINHLDSNDCFIHPITFEQIYEIYRLDKIIRCNLIEVINDIEVYFKTRLSNYLSIKYGSEGYLDSSNFLKPDTHNEIMDKINDLVVRNPKNLIVKHHIAKYNGKMPLWVVVEILSIGNISKLFTIMKNDDKKDFVSSSFTNVKYPTIESFFHSVSYFRNQCCHFQRLYDVSHTIKPRMHNTSFYSPPSRSNDSTFYCIYIVLLLNPSSSLGTRLIYNLKKNFRKHPLNISKYGFPNNWESILKSANGFFIDFT